MTSPELQVVEALLERALPDPRVFAERVLHQATERLTSRDRPGAEPAPTVTPAFDSTAQEMLSDRNVLLAAALGACECWGADSECPLCSGKGSPGWTAPDTALFAEYVQPAVMRSDESATVDKA